MKSELNEILRQIIFKCMMKGEYDKSQEYKTVLYRTTFKGTMIYYVLLVLVTIGYTYGYISDKMGDFIRKFN